MGRFKQGAFKIAMDMQLPVVPVSLTGCFEAMPSKQLYANLGSKISLHIGQPIDISQFTDINEAMDAVRQKVADGMK